MDISGSPTTPTSHHEALELTPLESLRRTNEDPNLQLFDLEGAHNWPQWKFITAMLLRLYGLYGYVDGSIDRPGSHSHDFDDADICGGGDEEEQLKMKRLSPTQPHNSIDSGERLATGMDDPIIWEKNNSWAEWIMMQNMSKCVSKQIIFAETAKEIWGELCFMFDEWEMAPHPAESSC